jgi:hypothetical protein
MAAPTPYPPELESWPELVHMELEDAVDIICTEREDITQINYVDVENGVPSPRQE